MVSVSHGEFGNAMAKADDVEIDPLSGKTLKQDPEDQQSMHGGKIPSTMVDSTDHKDEVIHSQVTRNLHKVKATDTRGALSSSPHVLDRCCVEAFRDPRTSVTPTWM